MENKILLNDQWLFTKQEVGTWPQAMRTDHILWEAVDLPHDWLIYNTQDLYESGEGWYKRELFLEKLTEEIISICFEGVYMDSTIFVNEQVVGEWKYGYSSFEVNITNFLQLGNNEIMVRVVHQAPNSRWYSGAGIYRNVWLKKSAPTHIVTDGIYLATRSEEGGWYLELETEAVSPVPVPAVLKHIVIDQGEEIAAVWNELEILTEGTLDHQSIFFADVLPWSIASPKLYTLKTQILIGNRVVDDLSGARVESSNGRRLRN